MNIDSLNKDIPYISVKDMNLEQFVSFCTSQYSNLYFSNYTKRLEYNNITLEDFINGVCISASKEEVSLFDKYPNASLELALELVSKEFPNFYPFKNDEFISSLSEYIDEQQSIQWERKRPPQYLPLNKIDFKYYRLDHTNVIEDTKLLECYYYPDLQKYVYRVSIPCSICGKERIHTLRMTLEEYKNVVVHYHKRVLKEAQKEIESHEIWKRNKDKISKALEQRLRIPNTSNYYLPKKLIEKEVQVTFIHKKTKEVLCTSSGVIKGIRPITREDFVYKMSNGSLVDAYHLAIYLEGVMFHEEEVKALIDIRPLDVIEEDLDISTPWFMSLEEPYERIEPTQKPQLKDPYPNILCLLEIKDE